MSEPADDEVILSLRGVTKSFGKEVVTEVLHGIDLELRRGELAALIGPSGSGKSTLLNLIGLLDRPTTGTIHLAGRDATGADDETLSLLRAETLGFVFQFHHLIGSLTALENLLMPLSIRGGWIDDAQRERAQRALESVGLGKRSGARPSELSGGQQQRVAIARALVHEPALVLADEPTGNLDTATADDIFAVLRGENRDKRRTILVVTHDPRLAARCDRIITMIDGRIASDVAAPAGAAPTVH